MRFHKRNRYCLQLAVLTLSLGWFLPSHAAEGRQWNEKNKNCRDSLYCHSFTEEEKPCATLSDRQQTERIVTARQQRTQTTQAKPHEKWYNRMPCPHQSSSFHLPHSTSNLSKIQIYRAARLHYVIAFRHILC